MKAIIFDLDGVLINSAPDMAVSINKTLENFSFSTISDDLIPNFIGNGARVLLVRSLATSLGYENASEITEVVSKDNKRMEVKNLPSDFPVSSEKIEEMLKWYIAYYKEHSVENTNLYPNVKEILEFCKNKNIRLSVVSNKPALLSKKILSLFKIDSYFDCIIGPEDSGKTKPAPDGLALAVELMNKNCKEKISLTEILMVGDSYYDIQAGKNLGCLTCGILGGYGKIVKGEKEKFIPDYYLDYVGDLNSILC
jgi:phosphoglycolate phosphatase